MQMTITAEMRNDSDALAEEVAKFTGLSPDNMKLHQLLQTIAGRKDGDLVLYQVGPADPDGYTWEVRNVDNS